MTTNNLTLSSIAYIKFSSIPPPSEATIRTLTPFTVQISAVDSNPHEIILYSQNSRSSPLKIDGTINKWSHLIPTWRFLDTNFNPITSVYTLDTEISSGNTFIGVTGEASFYYIDDLGTPPDSPVFIWATLNLENVPYYADTIKGDHDFPSYVNSKASVVTPFYVNSLIPTHLKITRNGLNEMSTAYYWLCTKIGNTITINGDTNASLFDCYDFGDNATIIYDYPSSNSLGFSMGEIEKSLVGFSDTEQAWKSLETGLSSLYFQAFDDDQFRIGGYVRTFVYPYLSSLNAMITAGVDVIYNSTERSLPFIWVNNPSNKYLHRILDAPVSSSLWNEITSLNPHLSGEDGQIFTYDTPYIETITDIWPLTGFGGGLGIALDPCFNAWVTDYEMDRLYKFSSTGARLSTIEFNGFRKNGLIGYTLSTNLSSELDYDLLPVKVSRTTITIDASSNSNAFSFDIELPQNSLSGDYYRSFRVYLSSSGEELYSKNDFLVLDTSLLYISASATNEHAFDDILVAEYKLASYNESLSTLQQINLSAYGMFYASQPAGISLDESGNPWVAFFNDNSVVKLNSDTGQLLVEKSFVDYGDPYYEGELTVRSTLVETDSNNNAWVSYNHPLSSKIVVLDSSGNTLSSKVLSLCSEPVDMCFDLDGDIWITLSETSGPPYLSGGVWKLDSSTMNVISAFSAVNPENITLDKYGNVWFTESFNTITKITSSGSLTSLQVGTFPTLWFDSSAIMEYSALAGIASDTFGRVWVINSYDSKVFVISNDIVEKSIPLHDDKISRYIIDGLQYNLTSDSAQSLQAFGDWSGLRWMMKYTPEYVTSTTLSSHLTGESDIFSIDSFNGYYYRKYNESWDTTNVIRDYALPYHIYQNYNLFINYLGNMIGGQDNDKVQIGRYAYERIANFVSNHSDPDTANIDQLYSLCKELDIPIDNYRFQYPFDIKRIVNIGSVSHNKLFGQRCSCNFNFKWGDVCSNCGHYHDLNVGESINTSTYIVSADVPFLAEYKFSAGNFEVVNSPISSSNLYSVVSTYLYNSPSDYNYYEYISTPCNVQVEGLINWGDEYTTLIESNSSLSAWYDEGQLLEKLFSIYLYRGLGI